MSSLLVSRGALVTLVTEERAIMNDVVPHYLSNHITWIMRRMGVEVGLFSTFVDLGKYQLILVLLVKYAYMLTRSYAF